MKEETIKNTDEKKLMKLIKDNNIQQDYADEIEIIKTDNTILVLVNQNVLYSVEWDGIKGTHYLHQLNRPETTQKKP